MLLKRLNVEVEAHNETEIKALKKQGFYPVVVNVPIKAITAEKDNGEIYISEQPEKPQDPEIDFASMTKKELVEFAEDKGLNVKGLSKAQIIDVITKG